jgi:3-hydroxyisobutyrate dehydrogenase-like beta-hydroxyacid dehydrogenase
MLPNDAVVESISRSLLNSSKGKSLTHVSCSTVSPATAKAIAKKYADENKIYVSAPVFARPDGIQKKQAIWMVSGDAAGRKTAASLLNSSGRVRK